MSEDLHHECGITALYLLNEPFTGMGSARAARRILSPMTTWSPSSRVFCSICNRAGSLRRT